MNFDFVEVFVRAWKITWKYKALWIFGMLASCGRGSSGNSNSNSNFNRSGNGGGAGDNPFTPEMTRQAQVFFERAGSWFEQNRWIVFAAIALLFLIIILQVFFSLVGIAGLARGVVRVENGAESLPFGELFSESLGYFWRLFGAGLVIWLPFMTIFALAVLAVMLPVLKNEYDVATSSGILLLLGIALCCFILPILIVLNFYHLLVRRSITIEDMGVFPALARGWRILIKNILVFLLVGIVLFIISFVIGILIALPSLFILLPLIGAFMRGAITSWQPFILVFVGLLCYSPFAWFLNGVLTAYTESTWTLTYLRLTKPKEDAPVFVEANA